MCERVSSLQREKWKVIKRQFLDNLAQKILQAKESTFLSKHIVLLIEENANLLLELGIADLHDHTFNKSLRNGTGQCT